VTCCPHCPQAAAVPDIEKIDMRVGLIVSAGLLPRPSIICNFHRLKPNCRIFAPCSHTLQRSTLTLTACMYTLHLTLSSLPHLPLRRYLEKIDVGEAEPRQVRSMHTAAARPS